LLNASHPRSPADEFRVVKQVRPIYQACFESLFHTCESPVHTKSQRCYLETKYIPQHIKTPQWSLTSPVLKAQACPLLLPLLTIQSASCGARRFECHQASSPHLQYTPKQQFHYQSPNRKPRQCALKYATLPCLVLEYHTVMSTV